MAQSGSKINFWVAIDLNWNYCYSRVAAATLFIFPWWQGLLPSLPESTTLLQYQFHLSLSWASLMHKPLFFISSYTTSSHDFFGLPHFIHPETLSFLTLLTKFISSILSRCPIHLSLVSPRWFSISSTHVLSSTSHSKFHHEASFCTSFSFLQPAFVWCQHPTSPNIQIHSSSHFLYKIYTNNLSASMTELSHILLGTSY